MSSRPSRPVSLLALIALFVAAAAAPLPAQSVMETLPGAAPGDEFGAALDNAGDVDGDGVDDLILGSPGANADAGAVQIVSGRTGDLIRAFAGNPGARLGHAVAGIGDLNGDGRSEVAFSAIGESKFEGGATSYDPVRVWDEAAGAFVFTYWSTQDADAGYSLAGGGDGNGDGVPDLLIGAPFHDTPSLLSAGRVYRAQIAAGVAFVFPIRTGDQAGEQLGWDVAWIGDAAGTGVDVFAVGSPSYNVPGPGGADVGRVHVLDGNGNLLWMLNGPQEPGGGFGWSLAGGADLSGDGLPDLVVGAPYFRLDARGRVSVHRGGNGTLVADREGDAAFDYLGWDVAVIERTSSHAILAGAPRDGDGGGLADPGVLHMLSTSAGLPTVWSLTGDASDGHLGRAIAVLRDMNGDGGEEFAVGRPFPLSGATQQAGRVLMLSGFSNDAAWSNYGVGLAGTLGVPELVALSDPLIPSLTTLHYGNSRGATTFGVVFYGFQTATLPFKGGFLQVNPMFLRNFPTLPTQGANFPVPAPDDHTFIGLRIYFQGAQLDPGALLGVSLTRPLLLNFGL